MKKQIISFIALLFVTQSVVAGVKEIQPCNAKQIQALKENITEKKMMV